MARRDDLDVMRDAEEASRLFDSRLLWEAFDAIEGEAIQDWKDTAPGEVDEREHAWHRVSAIQGVRASLQGRLDDAKKAERRAGRSQQ